MKTNGNGIKELFKRKQFWIIIILICFITLIIGIISGVLLTKTDGSVTNISHIFLDINGDGKIDYIIDAKVILNAPPLAPTSTPIPLP